MAIKKLLPLLFLFSVIFFEIKSSDGTGSDDEAWQNYKKDKTPLTFAAERGSVDEIKLLLADRADINEKDGTGKTALMVACNQDTVMYLMQVRADVNVVDNEGKNALMLSLDLHLHGANLDIFKLLIEAKTDLTVKDYKGSTVLDHAATKSVRGGSAIDLLADAYVGDSQADQERWAALIENARRAQREQPFVRPSRYWTIGGHRVLLE